jgi:hypothetical protein
MERIARVFAWTLVALLLSWSVLTLVDQFLGSDFQEQHASLRPPVPTLQATSLEAIANRVCTKQTDVLVVHYYRPDDPLFADQNKALEILNRHYEHRKIDFVSVELAKLPADERPHADTAIDVMDFNWRADGSGMYSAEGPQMPSWHDYPKSYRDLREHLDWILWRVAQSRRFASPTGDHITQCPDAVKGMLMMPAHQH